MWFMNGGLRTQKANSQAGGNLPHSEVLFSEEFFLSRLHCLSEMPAHRRLGCCGTDMAWMARLRFMTLPELLNAANKGYPDGCLTEYYDIKTGARKRGQGDTLAEFIVLELIDTFDSKAPDDSQISLATQMLERARRDILGVIQALEDESDTPSIVQ